MLVKTHLLFLLPAVILLSPVHADGPSGGPFAIASSTVDGGGGTSSGGRFAVSGTIGQPDAGVMTGGHYQIEGGFWPGIIPNAEVTLAMRPGGPGNVVLYWPVEVTGYTLEWQTGLGEDGWAPVPRPVVDNATEHTVTVPDTEQRLFFRLHR